MYLVVLSGRLINSVVQDKLLRAAHKFFYLKYLKLSFSRPTPKPGKSPWERGWAVCLSCFLYLPKSEPQPRRNAFWFPCRAFRENLYFAQISYTF